MTVSELQHCVQIGALFALSGCLFVAACGSDAAAPERAVTCPHGEATCSNAAAAAMCPYMASKKAAGAVRSFTDYIGVGWTAVISLAIAGGVSFWIRRRQA